MSDVYFCFEMPCTLLKKRVEKFQKQYQNQQNTVCQIVNNFKLHFTHTVRQTYDGVELH